MGFIISVANDKGGVGKTTTAINISVELSKFYNTTIVDLDPKRQISKFNSRREEKLRQFTDYDKIIDFLTSDNEELIIIDLGGFDSNISRSALLMSDLIIVPTSGSDNDIVALNEMIATIEEVIKKRKKQGLETDCSILVNRVHFANKTTHKMLSNYAIEKGINIFDTVIRQSAVFENMISSGKNVCELTQDTPSILINKLIEEIKTKSQ